MKKSVILLFLFVFSVCIVIAQNRQWTCGDDLVDSRDGKSYKTVLIGNQCWMAENLNYGSMIQSTKAGGEMKNDGVVEKYCWDNKLDNCDGTGGATKLGAFYEWSEAVQNYGGQPPLHVQGVCPDGWHIPSRNEFNQLMTDLGGSNVAGGKMKEGGSSGFEGILTGYRCTMSGSFRKSAMGTTWSAYYWAAEQSDASNAFFYELSESNNIFKLCAFSPFTKSLGNSIRCIENTSSSIDENENFGFHIKNINTNGLNKVNVVLIADEAGNCSFSIIDLNGKELMQKDYHISIGLNKIELNVANAVKNAIYFLKLTNNTFQKTEKIIFN